MQELAAERHEPAGGARTSSIASRTIARTSSRSAPCVFTLLDQDGEKVKLTDSKGRTVVLSFYPKADTPGS